MDGGDWDIASSSDEYGDPPYQTTWKVNAPYYEAYMNEDYGPDWPEDLVCDSSNANANNTIDALSSSITELNHSINEMRREMRHEIRREIGQLTGYIHNDRRAQVSPGNDPLCLGVYIECPDSA